MAVLAALIATPAHAGTWSKPVRVIGPSDQQIGAAGMAWGQKGGLVALAKIQTPRLVAATSPGSGPFSTPPQVIAGETQVAAVSVDPTGTAVAAFSGAVGLEPGVYYAVRPAGQKQFGSQIERLLDEQAGVELYASPAGETFAVMRPLHCTGPSGTCEASELHVAVKAPGAARFGPPQQVTAPGGHASDPVLRFDAKGSALLAWIESPVPAESHVGYAIRPSGGSFGTQRDIGADGPDHATTVVRLDSNSRGDLVAALEEYLPGDEGPVVQAAIGTVAGGLREPVTLSAGRGVGPRPAIDSRGQMLVAWRAGPSSERRIDFRVGGPAGDFLPRRTLVRGRRISLPTAIGGRNGWSVLWRVGPSPLLGAAKGQDLHVASLALPRLRANHQRLAPADAEFHRLLNTTAGETVVAFSRDVDDRFRAVYATEGRAGVGFRRPRRLGSSDTGVGFIPVATLTPGPGGRVFASWHEGRRTRSGDRESVVGAYYRP